MTTQSKFCMYDILAARVSEQWGQKGDALPVLHRGFAVLAGAAANLCGLIKQEVSGLEKETFAAVEELLQVLADACTPDAPPLDPFWKEVLKSVSEANSKANKH